MKYTEAELDAAAIADLLVDIECAERDGMPEYAAKCRAMVDAYKEHGAHKAVLAAIAKAVQS
jgi:hypothetical protein